MAKKWVKLNKDVVKHGFTTQGGQVGFIVENEKDMWGHEPGENEVVVRFPETFGVFNVEDLEEVEILPLEEAINVIKSYEGHHATDYWGSPKGNFQFNIKFYGGNLSPLAEKYLSEEEQNQAFYYIMEDEFRTSFTDDCDGNIRSDISWWDREWQDGRSGGYLIVQHEDRVTSCSIQYQVDELEDEKLAIQDEHDAVEFTLGNEAEGMAEKFDKDIAEISEEIHQVRLKANDLARELKLIDEHIKYLKLGLSEYMKTEDCWERHYDHKIEEEKEEQQYLSDKADGLKAWKIIKDFLRDSYFEEDADMKVIEKVEKLLYK